MALWARCGRRPDEMGDAPRDSGDYRLMRDGDSRAAYAIVDTTARLVELFRLRYPVAEAQAKILEAGLPEVLAQRLAVGR